MKIITIYYKYVINNIKLQIDLDLDKKNQICLNEKNNIAIDIYLFDANHCPGISD